MRDPLDVSLTDTDLLAEMSLTTELVIHASTASGPLAQHDIDRLLGI